MKLHFLFYFFSRISTITLLLRRTLVLLQFNSAFHEWSIENKLFQKSLTIHP